MSQDRTSSTGGSTSDGTCSVAGSYGISESGPRRPTKTKLRKSESCVSNDGPVPWCQRRLVPQQEAFSEISPMTGIGLNRRCRAHPATEHSLMGGPPANAFVTTCAQPPPRVSLRPGAGYGPASASWSALAPPLADVFTDDNDPNGEHDFGSVVHQGKQVFWEDRLLTRPTWNTVPKTRATRRNAFAC